VLTLALSLVLAAAPADAGDLAKKIKEASGRAANALIDRQNKDGGYGPQMNGKSNIGITALVVWALAESPAKYREWDGPAISKAVELILSYQKDTGGIHDEDLWVYKTSIGVMALASVDARKYKPQIDKAVAFLRGQQLNEESRVEFDPKKHAGYGGWGYGSDRRADLSNSQFAMEALARGDVPADDPIWKRSQVFLRRTQNSCDTNDAIKDGLIPEWGTNDDGGMMYRPGEGKTTPRKLKDGTWQHSSYGSMSYAGLKSFVFAQTARDATEVKKLYQWICKNYTVEENPGMATAESPAQGRQGLFYYYRTMAKALLAWGEAEVPTPAGARPWAADLAAKLLSLQNQQGLWVNQEEARWWEGIPEIATAYSILALRDCNEALTKPKPVESK
jgi:squalene-hopene/tetraprenyl-beta-curcumene cyclase